MSEVKSKYINGLIELERVFECYEEQPGIAFIGEEWRLFREHMEVHHLCQALIQHRFTPPFNRRIVRRKVRTDATDLGNVLLLLLEKLDLLIDVQDEESFFDPKAKPPEVEVVSKIGKAALSESGAVVDGIGFVPALPFRPYEYKYLTDSAVDSAVDAFNKLAMTMRKALLTSEMRLAIKNFGRNATERYKQLMRVTEQGWQTHYKNLLIRLDWGFKKRYPATRMRFKSQTEFESQLMEVDGYRKEMLGILRHKFGENLTFYAWKIECGDIKGLHIHWLIAVNGSKHQDRINVPRQIATLIDKHIGNGRTYTFNVNALPHAYQSGLRVIDRVIAFKRHLFSLEPSPV